MENIGNGKEANAERIEIFTVTLKWSSKVIKINRDKFECNIIVKKGYERGNSKEMLARVPWKKLSTRST